MLAHACIDWVPVTVGDVVGSCRHPGRQPAKGLAREVVEAAQREIAARAVSCI